MTAGGARFLLLDHFEQARASKVSTTKGFVSTRMPGRELAVADDGVFGIAGDEQHLQIGPRVVRAASAICRPFMPPGRPTSVISRSTRVSDCSDAQARGAVGGLDTGEAKFFQHFA